MTAENIRKALREAWSLRNEEQFDQAEQKVQDVLTEIEPHDFGNLGYAKHILMQIEFDHQHFEEALNLGKQSLLAYLKGNKPGRVGHAQRHLADVLHQSGDLIHSEIYYRMALHQYSLIDGLNDLYLANTYRGLALVLQDQKKIIPAKQFWMKAKEIYSENNIQEGVDEASLQIHQIESSI